jgi:hypothetical protein
MGAGRRLPYLLLDLGFRSREAGWLLLDAGAKGLGFRV